MSNIGIGIVYKIFNRYGNQTPITKCIEVENKLNFYSNLTLYFFQDEQDTITMASQIIHRSNSRCEIKKLRTPWIYRINTLHFAINYLIHELMHIQSTHNDASFNKKTPHFVYIGNQKDDSILKCLVYLIYEFNIFIMMVEDDKSSIHYRELKAIIRLISREVRTLLSYPIHIRNNPAILSIYGSKAGRLWKKILLVTNNMHQTNSTKIDYLNNMGHSLVEEDIMNLRLTVPGCFESSS
jgi:hypothetical protein